MHGFRLSYKRGLPPLKRSGKLFGAIAKNCELFWILVVRVLV